MYYVYILKSQKDGNLYKGSTQNLEKRVKQHNAGRVFSTKSRRPFDLIYFETFLSRSEAFSRELFFKSPEGGAYLKNVILPSLPEESCPSG
jgi:putative endonuclease